MESPADYKIEPGPGGPTASLSGSWTADRMEAAGQGLRRALSSERNVAFDLTAVERIDTAGAYALIRAAGADFGLDRVKARPETLRLMKLVADAAGKRVVVRP